MTTTHPVLHLRRSVQREQMAETGQTTWYGELAWVGAAAVVGFATTAVLAGWLALPRPWLVLVYAAVVVPLVVAYIRWSHLDLGVLFLRHWRWGVAGGIVAGALLVVAVQNQDGAARPDGARLAWDLLWLGVVYGLVDALLLNVLPVLATWRACSRLGWTDRWIGKIGAGLLAVAASLMVTAAYHLGYPEFRGTELKDPLIGNTIASLAYVLTTNPIAAVVSHVAMHIAAVLHGADGTVQLPPHY